MLLESGHVDAPDYPVTFVWEEVQLIVERRNKTMANDAALMNSAISTGIAAFGKDGGRKAQSAFTKLVNGLAGVVTRGRKPPPSPKAPPLKDEGRDGR